MFKRSQKFVTDIGLTFIATTTQTALAFIVTMILGKWLGAENLGLYKVILTLHGLMAILASLGIPSAIIKYVAEFKDNERKINQIVTSSIITVFSAGICFMIVFYLLSGVIAGMFKMPQLQELIKIISIVFPFVLVSNTLLGLLNGFREMKKFAFGTICNSVLIVVITGILVLLNWGVRGAVIGLTLSEIITCFLLLGISKKFYKLTFSNFYSTALYLTKFGFQILGAEIINTFNKQLDIIFIGLFLSPADVGYYSAAISLSRFFWLIPSSIQRITYPATSEYWSKQNHVALNIMTNKAIKYSFVFLLFIGMAVFFFGNQIVTILFSKDFTNSFTPLQILLIGTVIRGGLAQPIGASLTGIGKPGLVLKLSGFMLFTNILLDILLIPKIGINGAAVASSVSLSLGAIINLILMVKFMFIKIDWRWLLKISALSAIFVGLYKLGTHYVDVFLLGFILLIGFIITVAVFLLTKEDWSMLKSFSYAISNK